VPSRLRLSPRFKIPAIASVTVGALIIAATWAYLLATSAQAIFGEVVSLAGLLAAAFYILTALATIAYYRRRVLSNVWDAVILGVLLLAAAFFGWIIVKSVQGEPASQRWALAGIAAAGLIVLGYARFALRSAFFQTPRESSSGEPR
jgi:hypothetical protein